MYLLRLLLVALVLSSATAQNALTPIDRFEFDQGIVFPLNTQKLEGPACDNFLTIASSLAPEGVRADLQGFGCYARVSRTPVEVLMDEFNLSMVRGGYRLADEQHVAKEVMPGSFEERTMQTWLTQGSIVVAVHAYSSPQNEGLSSALALFVDIDNLTADRWTPASVIAFDPAIMLPERSRQVEGSSCERSIQNVKRFIESMNRPTNHLQNHRCYMVRTQDWRTSAQEVMASLSHASYTEQTFTAESLPVIYQVWTHANGQRSLTTFLSESRTGNGLFIVVSKH